MPLFPALSCLILGYNYPDLLLNFTSEHDLYVC
jgi:hypothetical protein